MSSGTSVRPADAPDGVRRALVRAPNWLGDVVLSLPALAALRRRFGGARLTVLVRSGLEDLLRGHPDLDEVLAEPRGPGRRSPGAVLRTARRLARERFDLAVVLARSFESALTPWLARIPRRVGLASHHRGVLLTDPLEETPERRWSRHHAEVLLDVARHAGAEGEAIAPRLAIGETERAEAAEALARAGLGAEEPLLLVHPGASRPERTWPAERFGRVARHLAVEHGLRTLVLGTPAEASLCRSVRDEAGTSAIALPGEIPLRTLPALHARARLVLGNDSGAMHVAAAAGAPVVGLFGPGDPAKTAPLPGPAGFEAVTLGFPCSPCRQRFFRECRPAPSGRPFCLHDVREDDVLGAARRLLARRP